MIKFTASHAVTLTRPAAEWNRSGNIPGHDDKTFALLDHWRSLQNLAAPDEKAPPFAAFIPGDIPQILPHLFLLERLACGTDWKIRLAGTYITDLLNRDITGLKLQEIDVLAGYHAEYRQFCEKIAGGYTAFIASGYKSGWARSYQHFEIVHAPVLSRDETSVWIMGGVFPNSPPEKPKF